MLDKVVLFWFRRDLRLHDNAGLHAALSSGLPVVPVFIFDPLILDKLEDRDDRRVTYIYRALQAMQDELQRHNSTLQVEYATPAHAFGQWLEEHNVQAVYTNGDYEPYATERDGDIEKLLRPKGAAFHTFKDQVIFEKNEVTKSDGNPYTIYGPYAKRWLSLFNTELCKPYGSRELMRNFLQQPPKRFPSLEQMGFTQNPAVPAVEEAAEDVIRHYHTTRDTPSMQGTTRAGLHLRFGTVSVRQLMAKAMRLNPKYAGELIWRDFFMQLLWHGPRLVKEGCKPGYDGIKWRNNEIEFKRWCDGQTGYPIVDAGMRELNQTGFMHNRVRMIAGSFLVKDLLIDWRWGDAYFARKLLDFELASNNGNWQWIAGCGCDAAPYFRVFNPALQQKRFDPKGLYVKKWVPEVDTLSYPAPMVDHNAAKERCLKAYKTALFNSRGWVYEENK